MPQVRILSLRPENPYGTQRPIGIFRLNATKVEKKTPDGIDYEITIDGKNGYATVAMTKYYDETEEPTLPINLGTHSIYFYAE